MFAVPIAAPEVVVTSLGTTSLKVEWKELPVEKARGVIVEYQVNYRARGMPSHKVERVAGDSQSYIIMGKHIHAKYLSCAELFNTIHVSYLV